MPYIGSVIYWLCEIYVLVLLARAIFSLVQMLSPNWQPTGILLVLLNLVYKLTDPPLRFLARYIPPLRVGNVAFDIGFILLFMGVQMLGTWALSVFG
ncbi:MAG: YggT family protein [Trueperella sp.]|nr:YggT family protein [Trueperella sp.]